MKRPYYLGDRLPMGEVKEASWVSLLILEFVAAFRGLEIGL